MFIYYLIYFLILIGAFYNLIFVNRYNKYLFVLFCLIIGMFSGLRYQTGFDHEPYLDYFNNLQKIDYTNGIPYLVDNMEIGFYFFNFLLKSFYLPSQFILLVPSLFCIYSLFKFTNTFKNNFLLVLLAYVSFNLVHNHFSLVRQSICVGLIYLAITLYIKNKKPFWIIILCATSLIFHITSIFYILIILLSIFLNPNKHIKIISIFLYFFSLTKIDLAFEFSKLLFNTEILSVITNKYLDYGVIEYKTSLSFYSYIIFNIIFIHFAFQIKNSTKISEKIISLVIYSSFIQILCMTIFPSNYILWSRISILTIVLQSLLFSIFISNIKLQNRLFLGTAYICVLLVFFIYNMTSMKYGLAPYKSIFNQIF